MMLSLPEGIPFFVNRFPNTVNKPDSSANNFAGMKTLHIAILFLNISLLNAFVLNAQDRFFGRTYTSSILPKGNFDIELWHTSRFGHQFEYFHAMDQRVEYEVGLGKNVQTAFYFNHYQKSINDSANNINQSTEIGFSNEWKWRISSAECKTEAALYAEFVVKGDELELESKLILDRTVDKNLLALNIVYEVEGEAQWNNGKTHFNYNNKLELDAGWMYQFSTSFGAGIELVNENDLSSHKWNNSILYGGPTINYRGNRWFVVANYLPQFGNIHASNKFAKGIELKDHERSQARIILGFSF